MPEWPSNVFAFLGVLLPCLLWAAFWLFAADWRKVGPVLRQGAWAPVVLLGLVAALAWSRVAPADVSLVGGLRLANFWWQLGVVGFLVGLALFAGWLQGQWGVGPPEVPIEPPPPEPGHAHGHH